MRATDETRAWIEPLAARCGVTRCGPVTGLDRIGVPVFQAFRPVACSIAVSAGKGPDEDSAAVSALMEAVELFHAETLVPSRPPRSYAQLRTSGEPALDPAPHVHERYRAAIHDVPLHWVAGACLLSPTDAPGEQTVSVPYDAVHCDFCVRTLSETAAGLFRMTSNGLASGSTRAEATAHALCELVERHAALTWAASTAPDQAATKLALDSITDDTARALLDALDRADVAVALWDISALGVPAYRCAICDRQPDGMYALMPALGAGCHPDPHYALVRAITEAIQSRLTLIAGAREDIGHGIYRAGLEPEIWISRRAAVVDAPEVLDFGARPRVCHDTVEDDIAWLLDRLRERGVDRAVAVDLSQPAIGVPVVRVLVPRLASPTPHAGRVHIDDLGH